MAASRWSWTVPSGAGEALRADRAILAALEAGEGQWIAGEPQPISRSALQRLMEEGKVLANGAVAKAGAKLTAGAEITVEFPEPRPAGIIPEDRPIEILFEDEHLLVLNKPAGLTVHPSTTQSEGTLVHALLHHIKDLSGIGGELRPGIVHRIDKNTSGGLVITKTDLAHRGLEEQFSRHTIEREYWAFCYGTPKAPKGRIETLIGRNPADRKKMSAKVKEGRKAVTHYERIEEFGVPGAKPFASWISARLETGRTHQVRVHLTELGHSLLGDPVYGTPSASQPKWKALPAEVRAAVEALPGQALHARVLGFIHPVTRKELRFEAPVPAAIQRLMDSLRAFR